MKQFKHLLVLVIFGLIVFIATLQNTWANEPINNGQDFTRPLTRFDIRQQYQEVSGGKNNLYTTLRTDKPFVLGNGWIFSTRFDLPLVYTNIASPDNPNGNREFGASDFLTQGLFIAPQGEKNWTYGAGLRAVFPIASQDEMGTGRLNIAPEVGAKIDTPFISDGSFVGLILSNHFDAGGYKGRTHINYLDIEPIFNVILPDSWFIYMSPEIQMNWEENSRPWFVPFDIMVGKVINKKIVISVEYETALEDDDYQVFKQLVEVRAGFFF